MEELRDRVKRLVPEHELIASGGDVTCLAVGVARTLRVSGTSSASWATPSPPPA